MNSCQIFYNFITHRFRLVLGHPCPTVHCLRHQLLQSFRLVYKHSLRQQKAWQHVQLRLLTHAESLSATLSLSLFLSGSLLSACCALCLRLLWQWPCACTEPMLLLLRLLPQLLASFWPFCGRTNTWLFFGSNLGQVFLAISRSNGL